MSFIPLSPGLTQTDGINDQIKDRSLSNQAGLGNKIRECSVTTKQSLFEPKKFKDQFFQKSK